MNCQPSVNTDITESSYTYKDLAKLEFHERAFLRAEIVFTP